MADTTFFAVQQGIAGTLNYISHEALHASGGACAETGRALVKVGKSERNKTPSFFGSSIFLAWFGVL